MFRQWRCLDSAETGSTPRMPESAYGVCFLAGTGRPWSFLSSYPTRRGPRWALGHCPRAVSDAANTNSSGRQRLVFDPPFLGRLVYPRSPACRARQLNSAVYCQL